MKSIVYLKLILVSAIFYSILMLPFVANKCLQKEVHINFFENNTETVCPKMTNGILKVAMSHMNIVLGVMATIIVKFFFELTVKRNLEKLKYFFENFSYISQTLKESLLLAKIIISKLFYFLLGGKLHPKVYY